MKNAIAIELKEEYLNDFLVYRFPKAKADEIIKEKEKFLKLVDQGFISFSDVVVLMKKEEIVSSAMIKKLWKPSYFITPVSIKGNSLLSENDYLLILKKLIKRSKLLRGKAIYSRILKDNLPGPFIMAMNKAGFNCFDEKIEFRAEISKLPYEIGTPLRWQSLQETSVNFASEMLKRVSENSKSPIWRYNDIEEVLLILLNDLNYNSSSECVQIGYFNMKPIAFVLAQANKNDNTGTISYLGIVYEERGKGLGIWSYLHGFEMLRQQGVEIYEGGTHLHNGAMLKLFRKFGCVEIERMIDWELFI